MTRGKWHEWGGWVRLLSLLLAALLWLSVFLERPAELRLRVPLRAEGLPAGLRLDSPLPESVVATLSGPRIVLFRLWLGGTDCTLDLATAATGAARLVPLDAFFRLDPEVKLLRVNPASLSLRIGDHRRSGLRCVPASTFGERTWK